MSDFCLVFSIILLLTIFCILYFFQGGNILVSNDGTIKLADFGASKRVEEFCAVSDEMEMTMRGTP